MDKSGNKTSSNNKIEPVKRLLLLVVSAVLLFFGLSYSFGWFSFNSALRQDSMELTVSTESYDVLVERTTEYDVGYNFIAGSGELKDKLEDEGFDLTETDTADALEIAYEMVNEFEYESKYYIMPGSYGTVTFYVRPMAGGGDFVANFALNLGAYVVIYDEETPILQKVTSDSVLDMLKGHILFFTGRTGATYADYEYSGLIENGTFSFDTSLHSLCNEVGKTDCYEIVLYWEWPITYIEITDGLSTKYPSRLSSYITAHKNYFFAELPEIETEEALSDAYNDGDQLIGTGADCLVLYILAH